MTDIGIDIYKRAQFWFSPTRCSTSPNSSRAHSLLAELQDKEHPFESGLISATSSRCARLRWLLAGQFTLSCKDVMTFEQLACSLLALGWVLSPSICIGSLFPSRNPCTSSAAVLRASRWCRLQISTDGRRPSLMASSISTARSELHFVSRDRRLAGPRACISFHWSKL